VWAHAMGATTPIPPPALIIGVCDKRSPIAPALDRPTIGTNAEMLGAVAGCPEPRGVRRPLGIPSPAGRPGAPWERN
jgi:hypothetical protein